MRSRACLAVLVQAYLATSFQSPQSLDQEQEQRDLPQPIQSQAFVDEDGNLIGTPGSPGPTDPPLEAGDEYFVPPSRKVLPLVLSEDKLHYMGLFDVGTPPQQQSLILDTASSEYMQFNRTFCRNRDANLRECFNPSVSTSFSTVGLTESWSLVIDNERVTAGDTTVSEDAITATLDLVGSPATERTASTRVKMLVANGFTKEWTDEGNALRRLHNFEGNDGLLGMMNLQSSAFRSIFREEDPFFSLDFGEAESAMYIGGIKEDYRDSLQWGAPAASRFWSQFLVNYYTFEVFEPKLCGDHLGRFGSSYEYRAIVDTGASCLKLPAEIFDGLQYRLPLACIGGDDPACYVARNLRVPNQAFPGFQPLPTFSFRMKPNGEQIHINLADLLIQPDTFTGTNPGSLRSLGPRLCVTRGRPADGSATRQIVEFSFGARALRSVFAAFDMDNRRVGLANKYTVKESTVQCVAPKTCTGMQTRDEALNLCLDPPCSSYYFFSFDEKKKVCYLSKSFHILAIVFISTFVLVEVGMHELEDYYKQKVEDTVPLS